MCVHRAATVTLTHSCWLAPWRKLTNIFFKKFQLTYAQVVSYIIHCYSWDPPSFIMSNTLSLTHTLLKIHLSPKLTCYTHSYTPATGLTQFKLLPVYSQSHSLFHTHILCRPGGHWIIMLPPGETDRCVSMCVCQAVLGPLSWYLLVLDSWGAL